MTMQHTTRAGTKGRTGLARSRHAGSRPFHVGRTVGVGAAALACFAATLAAKPPDKHELQQMREKARAGQSLRETIRPSRRPKSAEPTPPPKIEGPHAILKAAEDTFDFGTVWIGPDLEHAFVIKNEGDAELKIHRVKPSCGCTIAGPYPKTIAPGESGEFPFSVKSTRLRGSFAKWITITSNDPINPNARLQLRGEVRRYVDVVPPNVYFGKIHGDEPTERVLKLANNTDHPMDLTLASDLKDKFDVELVPKTPGQLYELHVTAKPPFQPGVFREALTLNTNIDEQKRIDIDIRGSIPQRLDVSPRVINLRPSMAPAKDDQPIRRLVRFTNYGRAPVNLVEATVDDPAIKTDINERVDGKAYTVQIEIPAGYEIPPEGRNLTLKSDDSQTPTIVVPIKDLSQPQTAQRPAPKPAESLVGKQAPSFQLTTVEGKPFNAEQLKGNVTVLDFFAPNCPHCKKQIPRLEQIRKTYADKGVRFVAVSQKMGSKEYSEDQVVQILNDLGFQGELAINHDNAVGRSFRAMSFPTMVLVGKSGDIEAVNIGNVGDLEKRLKAQLDALVAGKPVPDDESLANKPDNRESEKPVERKKPEDLVGKPAPNFAIKTLDGNSVSNADLKDHPATILNFVAANCGFCKKQIPRVEGIRKKYTDKNVRFVNVVQTMRTPFTAEQVASVMKQLGADLELAHDPDNTVGSLFYATGYPTMVVLGKSGKVEAVNVGNKSDLENLLTAQLDALIAGKAIEEVKTAALKNDDPPQPPKNDDPPKPAPTVQRADQLLGKPAPSFSMKTLEDKSLSSKDFADHAATILNFVAGNCGYCKKQIPRVEQIRKKYTDKDVRFVNVAQTMRTRFTPEQLVDIMDKIGSHLELAHDPDNSVGTLYGVRGFPTMVVVGKNGKVEAVNVGNLGDLETRLTKQLDALIAGKPVPKVAAAPQRRSRRPAEDLVGKPVPSFTLTTLKGKTVTNASLSEHPATVLNFVAPNCGFCKRQIPTVEKIRQDFEEKGVRFINVVQKMRKDFSPEQIVDIMKGVGSQLELALSDFDSNKVGGEFKAVSFPTMVVVDRSGKVAHVNIGAKPDLDSLLRSQLGSLVQNTDEDADTAGGS